MTVYEINKLIHDAKEGDVVTINGPVEIETGQYICGKEGVTVILKHVAIGADIRTKVNA